MFWENIGNYRKIQLSDQKEGWIVKSAIKEIEIAFFDSEKALVMLLLYSIL